MLRNCGLSPVIGLILLTSSILSNPVHNLPPEDSGRSQSDNGAFSELKIAYKVYKDCSDQDLSVCLKMKLLTALDRVGRVYKRMPILNEWVEIVKIEDNTIAASESSSTILKETDLDASLPRSIDDRESALNQMLIEKIVHFFQTHTFQVKLPSVENMQRSLTEEGRVKKKKLGNLLMLPLMVGGTIVPLILGGIAILAVKALFVAKVALVLALIVGMKKLLGGSLGGDKQEYVVNSAPTSWSRSINNNEQAYAQQLAYSAHVPSDKVN